MRLFTVLGLALAGLAFANDSVLEDDTGVEYLQKSPAFSDSVYANASIYAANLIDLHGRDGLGLFGESPLTKRQRTCPGQAFCGAGCMPIGNSCCTTYHCPSGWGCCRSTGTCAPPGGRCCSDGTYCNPGYGCCNGGGCAMQGGKCCGGGRSCKPGYDCCGSNCMVEGRVCCSDGRSCAAGTNCCSGDACARPGGQCCQDGSACRPGYKCCTFGCVAVDSDCTTTRTTTRTTTQTTTRATTQTATRTTANTATYTNTAITPTETSRRPPQRTGGRTIGMNGQQRRRVENDEIAFEGEWVSELSCDPAEAGKRISTSASFGIEYTHEIAGVTVSHSVNEEGEITLGWGLEQELPSGVGISTGYEVSEDLGGTPNQTAIGTGCAVKFAYEVSQEFKTMAGYTQTMGLYVEVPIVVPGTIEDRKRQENEAIQNWFRLNTITVYATKEEFDKAIEGLETKTQPPVQLDVSGLGDGSPESAAASMATDLAASGGPTTSLRPSVSIAANNIPNVSNKAHESVRLSALSIAGVVSVCVYLLL